MRKYTPKFIKNIWKVAPENMKFMGVDDFGILTLFEDKPIPMANFFKCVSGDYISFDKVDLCGMHWADSLRERPKVNWIPKEDDDIYEVSRDMDIYPIKFNKDKLYCKHGMKYGQFFPTYELAEEYLKLEKEFRMKFREERGI